MVILSLLSAENKIIDLQELRRDKVEALAYGAGFVEADEILGVYFSKVLLQPVKFQIFESSMRVTLPIDTDAETVSEMLKVDEELCSLMGEGWYGTGANGDAYSFTYETTSVRIFTEKLEDGLKGLVDNNKIVFED